MSKYKTAQGKVVDMSMLAALNEKTRAVGNMKVNARGDTIDSVGRVIQPVTAKVNDAYAKTVGNRSANVVKAQENAAQRARPQNVPQPEVKHIPQPTINSGVNAVVEEPVIDEPLSKAELELENELEDDIEVEQIKAKETRKK